MTLAALIRAQPSARIAEVVREIVGWRRTGILHGDALTSLAREAGFSENLDVVESAVLLYAAEAWANAEGA